MDLLKSIELFETYNGWCDSPLINWINFRGPILGRVTDCEEYIDVSLTCAVGKCVYATDVQCAYGRPRDKDK